jgi:hypothetical protein
LFKEILKNVNFENFSLFLKIMLQNNFNVLENLQNRNYVKNLCLFAKLKNFQISKINVLFKFIKN